MTVDVITRELIRNRLEQITDDMTLTVLRTSYSGNVRDGMDFSTAVCDARGRIVAQGLSIALHLGSMPDAIVAVLDKFKGDLRPGDVVILNDPYTGGMHLPDIFMFKPLFHGRRLVAFAAIVADHADIGGNVAGGRSIGATEVYQEGLRIPPLKLVQGGRRVAAVWEIIEQNVRMTTEVLGDLNSCLAACDAADRMLAALVNDYGAETVERYFEASLTLTERALRQVIRDLPDGRWSFLDHLDDWGVGREPVNIAVAMVKTRDRVLFDFSGTSEQVAAAINSTFSFTKAAVYAAVRTLVDPDLPNNAGYFRPIAVRAPLGTIVNPRAPAAVSSRGVTGHRVVDAVMGVLAQVAPDRMPAASEGGPTSIRIACQMGGGRVRVAYDSMSGAWGARPNKDGIDGCSSFAANIANVPVEVIESEFPLRITRYGLRQDSGGAGKWRGGMGLVREWQLLGGSALATVRADRARFRPWGLRGGEAGGGGSNHIVSRSGDVRSMPSKFQAAIEPGERLIHQQAGGGGYGSPLERDPGLVLRDWRDERVSRRKARTSYGVVIGRNGNFDATATRRLRKTLNTGGRPR